MGGLDRWEPVDVAVPCRIDVKYASGGGATTLRVSAMRCAGLPCWPGAA